MLQSQEPQIKRQLSTLGNTSIDNKPRHSAATELNAVYILSEIFPLNDRNAELQVRRRSRFQGG